MQYEIKYRAAMDTLIRNLQEIRDQPNRDIQESFRVIDVCNRTLPMIRRCLMWMKTQEIEPPKGA